MFAIVSTLILSDDLKTKHANTELETYPTKSSKSSSVIFCITLLVFGLINFHAEVTRTTLLI